VSPRSITRFPLYGGSALDSPFGPDENPQDFRLVEPCSFYEITEKKVNFWLAKMAPSKLKAL
jgi:hypothetical protein